MEREAKAYLSNARISARKVKIVIDTIRDKKVDEALALLKYTNKAAAPIVYKLLKSAIANATNNHNLDSSKLVVSEVYANQGPTMKRVMPKAKGNADRIRKRSSHITIIVKEV